MKTIPKVLLMSFDFGKENSHYLALKPNLVVLIQIPFILIKISSTFAFWQ